MDCGGGGGSVREQKRVSSKTQTPRGEIETPPRSICALVASGSVAINAAFVKVRCDELKGPCDATFT